MNNPPRRTSRALAERHEAVWLEMTTLARQVAAIAGRRPDAMVPGTVRVVAGALIAEAACFARPRGEDLPVVAGDYADRGASRLYTWDAKGPPRNVLEFRQFNPEGFFSREARNQVLLLSDDGSVLIDGTECKRLDDPQNKRFRGRWVTIPSPDP